MFKKMLIVAAGMILSGNAVLAQPAPAVADPNEAQPSATQPSKFVLFRTQANGHTFSLYMTPDGDTMRGMLTIDDQRFPFTGKPTSATVIEGTIEISGRSCTLKAERSGKDAIVSINGQPMKMARVTDSSDKQQNEQPAPVVEDAGKSGIPQTLHHVDGTAYRYDVPAGWQSNEQGRSVTISSKDGKIDFGAYAVPAQESPVDVLKECLRRANAASVKVVRSTPVKSAGEGLVFCELEAELTMANGETSHVWMLAAVSKGTNATVFMASSASDASIIPQLRTLSLQIRPIDPAPQASAE